jgi:hypothetical protein
LDSLAGALVSKSRNDFATIGWIMPAYSAAAFTPDEGFHYSIYAAALGVSGNTVEFQAEPNTILTIQ